MIRREKGKTLYCPMELMTICDFNGSGPINRCLRLTNLTKKGAVKAICAQRADREAEVRARPRTERTSGTGAIRFDERSMEVESRIEGAGNELCRPIYAAGCETSRYLIPANCLHWCAK
uniref:Uncharacterized protein n=1 Tax=Globodera pallida TaxID=36090 RepID=A0A183BU80_GLOPA